MTVGAIILAAGEGKRMGAPKATVPFEGGTCLTAVVNTCREAGCDPIWVVLSPALNQAGLVADLPVLGVVNPHPQRGMFSSVLEGLEVALQSQAGGFVLFPVDHPHVKASTVQTLAANLTQTTRWVRPVHQEMRGHPIAIARPVASQLLNCESNGTLREALRSSKAQPHDVTVQDSGIVKNLNYPQDRASH